MCQNRRLTGRSLGASVPRRLVRTPKTACTPILEDPKLEGS